MRKKKAQPVYKPDLSDPHWERRMIEAFLLDFVASYDFHRIVERT